MEGIMNKRTLLCLPVSIAVVWVLSAVQPLPAQVLYGSIVGNVKDPSGAAVAGALVTLTSVETRQSRQVTTTEDGGYDFPTIPAGIYELKFAKTGFNTASETGVGVVANNILR